MTLRVLGHTHAYPPANNAGGPLTMHALLVEGRDRRGWDVSVLLDSTKNGLEFDGVPVTTTRSVATMREKYRIADVVLTHLDATRRAMAVADPLSKPLVHLIHNHRQLYVYGVEAKPRYLAVFNSIWLNKATVWSGARQTLHPPVRPENYRVRPNGKSVVLVNRTTSKGAELFYKLALANPQYDFIAVTGGYGQQITVPYGHDNLHEVSSVTDMRKIYKQARVVLMPSLYESWGRVAIEAAVSGIPTLGSDVYGLQESQVCAGLLPVNDFDTWNLALRLIMDDEVLWKQSSDNAMEKLQFVQQLTEMELERTLDAIEALAL